MTQLKERTLWDLWVLNVDQQPLCITYPAMKGNFEVRSRLIYLLSSFSGRAGEDPHKHLKKFIIVCEGIRLHGITKEQINLRAFPFSLKDDDKDWLYLLPPGSVTTWKEM